MTAKRGPKIENCKHCGSVLSAVTWTCVRGKYCPGEKTGLQAGGLGKKPRPMREASSKHAPTEPIIACEYCGEPNHLTCSCND